MLRIDEQRDRLDGASCHRFSYAYNSREHISQPPTLTILLSLPSLPVLPVYAGRSGRDRACLSGFIQRNSPKYRIYGLDGRVADPAARQSAYGDDTARGIRPTARLRKGVRRKCAPAS